MSVETFTPSAMQFTQGAANKVKSLVDEEGNPRLKLRVFVTGGGCSGFQYGFTFDEEVAEDDTIIEREGVSLVVDPMSFQYLAGAGLRSRSDLQVVQTSAVPCARRCRFWGSQIGICD